MQMEIDDVETAITFPPPPKTLGETGLPSGFVINLISKIMNEGGTMTPADISRVIKLPRPIVRSLIDEMVSLQLVESQGLETASIKSDIRYSLTDLGARWAIEAMMASQYVGPAPVTLQSFENQIRHQSIKREQIHREDLRAALSHLVIPESIMPQLGPAANCARSMLLYGEPGNGKTSIAEALGKSFHDVLYFPYALLVGNQIIQFFDETLHDTVEMADNADPLDPRWVPCKRPVVIAGGELTLEMLDLSFEPSSRFYEAPMHLKALGGIFVLDDFGRQRSAPQEFLNRWIVPLEKGFDILSLHTGKKFNVPFDQLVVFSTNIEPEGLSDAAALRRIYFKIFVPSPTKADYLEIFERACRDENLTFNAEVAERFFEEHYTQQNIVTSGAHPGFLVKHILAACTYLEREPELSLELLELAWRNVSTSKRLS